MENYYERLPTRTNHNDRGTDLNSTRCPLCSEDQEPVTHVFCNVKWWLTYGIKSQRGRRLIT